MLSCFPFSYSPLKDDEYTQIFIGQEDHRSQEANDNCLNISLNSVNSEQSVASDKLRALVNSDSTSRSDPLPSTPTSDKIKLPVPVPRTFRKPDFDSCVRNDSTTVANTSTNTLPISSSTKSSLLKLGFHRSKGTEHLQQEAIRKSNEANSALHSQRYIKLPTSSIARFTDSSHNQNSNNSKLNTNLNNKNNKWSTHPHNRISGSSGTSSPSVPKPPLKTLDLCCISSSSAPSCSLLKGSPKPSKSCSPQLSPKPPPRPLTSHPGLSSNTSSAIMPLKKASVNTNTSDTNTTSAQNDDNVSNVSSNTTRETSLTASSNASSLTVGLTSRMGTNGCQSTSAANSQTSDWNKSGTFINKPARGWLHPDQQIADTGISYSVRVCLTITVVNHYSS